MGHSSTKAAWLPGSLLRPILECAGSSWSPFPRPSAWWRKATSSRIGSLRPRGSRPGRSPPAPYRDWTSGSSV
jgi:hypothetical protein